MSRAEMVVCCADGVTGDGLGLEGLERDQKNATPASITAAAAIVWSLHEPPGADWGRVPFPFPLFGGI